MTIRTFYRVVLWLPLVMPISFTGWLRSLGMNDGVPSNIMALVGGLDAFAAIPLGYGYVAIVLVLREFWYPAVASERRPGL